MIDSIDSLNNNSNFSDKVSHYKGIQESILKPTNRKLLDSNWENNIIWDTKVSSKKYEHIKYDFRFV